MKFVLVAFTLVSTLAFAESPVWTGVQASPAGDGTVALWNSAGVVVSRDSGHRFRALSNRSLGAFEVTDVVVARSASVVVLTSEPRIVVVSARGRETSVKPTWLRPGGTLLQGGTRIGWIGPSADGKRQVLAVSADDGATFSTRDAPPAGNSMNVTRLFADGTVQMVRGWEAGCGGGYQRRYVTTLADSAWHPSTWPLDAPVDAWPTTSGRVYAIDDCENAMCLVLIDGDADHRVQAGASALHLRGRTLVASNDTADVAIVGGLLYGLAGTKAATTGSARLSKPSALALDGAGTVYAIGAGDGWRFDQVAGWVRLTP